jgi:hypothetical protein
MKSFLPIFLVITACCIAQDEPRHEPVKIINGPVVEMVTDSQAQIAWSTNENSGTVLHYGADAGKLDQTAGMPWGGLTHRVFLRDLTPSTTYYFKAESNDGQGTGTRDESAIACFRTVAAGQPELQNANCSIEKDSR